MGALVDVVDVDLLERSADAAAVGAHSHLLPYFALSAATLAEDHVLAGIAHCLVNLLGHPLVASTCYTGLSGLSRTKLSS